MLHAMTTVVSHLLCCFSTAITFLAQHPVACFSVCFLSTICSHFLAESYTMHVPVIIQALQSRFA